MNTVNIKKSKWIKPWNTKQFNDLYNRDERFFSILLKGTIAYLNSHIKMYDQSINHFVFNTGSSYMYVESNGYEFSWNETSGEDTMYMELPRCVIQMNNIDIPMEELSQPFARGNYEHQQDGQIKGFNAEIQRIPIELSLDLHYVFSNFNEGIVVLQELFDEFVFQRYFNIVYLGQIVQCSIEFATSYNIELNKIDLGAAEPNTRNLNISVKICTNYPVINEKTEISTSKIISKFGGFINQSKNRSNIDIIIDGVKSNEQDIYLDLKQFDLNDDNQINDDEINLIYEFINKFDIDKDEEVTTHDMNLIAESFYNDVYNINYDILNKGVLDMENLLVIKKLFNTLDINHDNIINQLEIDTIVNNISLFKSYDINHDLKIDYNDINTIIQYITDNDGLKFIDLYQQIKNYIKENIDNKELTDYILTIINEDLNNYKLAIEYYLKQNSLIIEQNILKELYQYIDQLVDFKKYDFNNDNIINKDDLDNMTSNIYNYTNHKITYYKSSNIIIHSNDHNLSNESISDIIDFN